MVDLGNVAAFGIFAFAFGTAWYELLRRPQTDKLRLSAISLVGIVVAETMVADGLRGGPTVLGLHPVAALIASGAAVYIDVAWQEHKIWPWSIIDDLRHLGRPFKVVRRVKVSVGGEDVVEIQEPLRRAA